MLAVRLAAFVALTALGVFTAVPDASAARHHGARHHVSHHQGKSRAEAPPLTLSSVNDAAWSRKPAKGANPVVLKAAILLDRAGFSPGSIDAVAGDNFKKALRAYRAQNGMEPSDVLDQPAWSRLTEGQSAPVLVEYEITDKDVEGPFAERIPKHLEDQARLKRLSYTSPREMLAERFHMQEKLLQALNPKVSFKEPGTKIVVADVSRPQPPAKVAKVVVDKTELSVRAFAEDGALVAFYPASIGSGEKPAPSGEFKVRGVARNPPYHYNPAYHFKGVKTKHRFTVPAGPNNPVGAVWIDLTAPSYGIHGTPEPDNVSKTESHGCIRLTNWDALALADLVRKGTLVDFVN